MKDLDRARQIDPNNVTVRSEIVSLKSTMTAANCQDKNFATNVLNYVAGANASSRKSSSGDRKIDANLSFVFEDDAIPLEPNWILNCIRWAPKTESSITPEVTMEDNFDNPRR